MKPNVILCHYGEIGLKGKNRSYFEKKLQSNLRDTLQHFNPDHIVSVDRLFGRLVIRLNEIGQTNLNEILRSIYKVCGLVYFAPAINVASEMDVIIQNSVELMDDGQKETFRVTARRTDKNFPKSAQKMNEDVGAAILEKTGKTVNLGSPDKSCYIDVVDGEAFIYTQKRSGQGGLPVGVSGKVLSLLSGGIDSPVASYYSLKRGASVSFVHFHSVPYTNEASIEKVREMIHKIQAFQQKIKLHLVELAPIQKEVMVLTEEKYRILLYRRFMVRIAELIAKKQSCGALVTGDSLGQVASQTLENMGVIENAVNIPVLRPLVGLDKVEIIQKANEIDTYEISIKPDQDCCSLFIPKHPATKAKLKDILNEENKLNVKQLIHDAVLNSISENFS